MNVFVTGGTGFIGSEVLWMLRDKGHSIRLLARDPNNDSTRQLAYRHQAEIVQGAVDDCAALSRGMSGCSAVIHLVGIIAEFGENTFQSAHVAATKNVTEVATDIGIQKFIQMSALGSRDNAVSNYHQTKWQAEKIVRESKLDWTIFRPSVVFGRDDGFVNLLAKICRVSPLAVIMGNGKNALQPIAVEDVAHCIVSALEIPDASHRTFDLCGTEVFTLNQIYDLILQSTKRRRMKIHVPMPLASAQAMLMETVFGLLGKQSPLTRDQLLMLREDNVGDPQPAMTTFDFQPLRFAEGIARYIA